MSDRDKFLQAVKVLKDGSLVAKTSRSACQSAYDTFRSLSGKLKPKDESDIDLQPASLRAVVYSISPGCFAKAGDCEGAVGHG